MKITCITWFETDFPLCTDVIFLFSHERTAFQFTFQFIFLFFPKKLLTYYNKTLILILALSESLKHVRVAQLDRASGYGPEGREFESSRAR